MVNEELKWIIEASCEDKNIYQYILKCLEYFKNKNSTFCNSLYNSILILMLKYPNFKIICSDSSYFSSSRCELAISRKAIETRNYATFIHEITHAIHGLQYSYNIPSEYEYVRNQTISNDNFMSMVRDLMRYIIQSKKAIIEQAMKNTQLLNRTFTFEKINKEIKIDHSKINNNIELTSNINNLFKIIDNITPSLEIESLITISNQLNEQFESLIDNNGYTNYVGERFHVLSSMEGMIDSLLVGALQSGYKNNCFYLEGWGHKKEYFEKNPENSYIELLADYTVLIAYNDATLIEVMEKILGKEMSDLLRTSLNLMVCEENINYIKR